MSTPVEHTRWLMGNDILRTMRGYATGVEVLSHDLGTVFHFTLAAGGCTEIFIADEDFFRFPWHDIVIGSVFELTRKRP